MDFDYVVVPTIVVLIGILVVWLATLRILSLRRRSYPTWRKITERIVLSLAALIAVAIAGISGFNAIVLRAKKLPGKTYLVNGHGMRIDCRGTGSPTIVLEAGGGNDGLIWGGVQPVLAKTTRVCSYDRAGYGGSQALPPPRDADHIAVELHGLLTAAKVDQPIVLIGHSHGGIYIRDYATRYPDAIAGLVFVDSSTPLQDRNPAFKAIDYKRQPQRIEMLLERVSFDLGIPRLFGACSGSFPGFDPHAAKLHAEDRCHEPFGTIASEGESMDRDGEETVHTGPYKALPILIFSHDSTEVDRNGQTVDLEKAFNQMQEDLKRLSTCNRRIIAKGSGHYVQLDRPELVEKYVSLFIEQIRGKAPKLTDFGSTTTK